MSLRDHFDKSEAFARKVLADYLKEKEAFDAMALEIRELEDKRILEEIKKSLDD